MSQFLHFTSAVNKITLSRKPGYAHLPARKVLYRDLGSGFDQICTATLRQCLRPKFLHRDSKLVASGFVPRWRQNASQIVPGRQKLRHAFAYYGLGGLFFIANFHSPAFSRSAPKTTFIAGPLAATISIPELYNNSNSHDNQKSYFEHHCNLHLYDANILCKQPFT